VEAHQESFPVRRMCQVLNVTPSGYYAWRKRPVSAREMANRELVKGIEAVQRETYQTYGSPRVWCELKARGVACSKNRVARLMRLYHLGAKRTKRFKAMTRRARGGTVAPNLLKQTFAAEGPGETWLADITYIPTDEGWLYLAAVVDLYSRYVPGWDMSERMTSDLTRRALNMAIQRRPPTPGLIHHSDQGSQYTADAYQALLQERGIRVSMNETGGWYDNAPMKSFFATLKSELVNHRHYATRAEARADVFYYIEAFYNRRRRHSSLGYLSPEAYEELSSSPSVA
jgi:putative transposase